MSNTIKIRTPSLRMLCTLRSNTPTAAAFPLWVYAFAANLGPVFPSNCPNGVLPVEGITADKFPDEARWGDLVVDIGLLDVVEDLDDATHLLIACLLRLYFIKQGGRCAF